MAALRDAPGPLSAPRNVIVAAGGSIGVARDLHAAGVIDDPRIFRLLAWWSREDGALRAAEFAFPARASLRQVLIILRTARPVEYRITIPEGLTAREIAALLNQAEAAEGLVEPLEEGAVLPETYAYVRGAQRATILARARAAMDAALAAAWAKRAPELNLASPRDALILASIVERETRLPAERARIAAVYLNRLKIGMRLQADPTVAYAVAGRGALERKLTRADLERDDPYNTYRVAGLPPGPICSPGTASLWAATHPEQIDELFFVADGNGGHAFARTWEEHRRNVAHWRRVEDR